MSKREQVTDKQITQAMERARGNITHAAVFLSDSVGFFIPRKTMSNWVNSLKKNVKPVDAMPKSVFVDKKRKIKRYIVSCYINNTDVHKAFFANLKRAAKYLDAELVMIPIRYKNVTAYISKKDFHVWWPSEPEPYVLRKVIQINDNLIIKGDFKIEATALDPLQGLDSIGKHCSVIVGHPQLAMKLIPTPKFKLPKMITTTGTVSLPHYSESKRGAIAEFNHNLGALLIESDGDAFWVRELNATDDGSFYDLDTFYSAEAEPEPGNRVDGIVYGDLHELWLDPDVRKATWEGDDSIVAVCRPRHHYIEDGLDFYSQNHHERKSFFGRFARYKSGLGNVENELKRLVEFNNTYLDRDDWIIHWIDSNHNNALGKWLNEADPKQDPENAIFYHRMMVEVLSNIQGIKIPDPLEIFMMPRINNPERTIFHTVDDEVILNDIDHSQHGHIGPNGSKGSARGFARSGYRSWIGHTHSPFIFRGCWGVGTSSLLRLSYNGGYSSWLHCHGLDYPNGKRSLIMIVKGRWRAGSVR